MYRIINKNNGQILIDCIETYEKAIWHIEDITQENMLYKKDELKIIEYGSGSNEKVN